MTHRVHNLAPLRATIKFNATRARELRQEAREASGELRYDLKSDANDYGEMTRYPHLALGYLRGRTIAQMESETTRPDNLPSAASILAHAEDVFLRGPDAPSWPTEERTETHKTIPVPDDRGIFAKLDPPGWDEFKAMVEADITAWHAKCLANHAMNTARRAVRKAPAGGSEACVVA